MDDKTQKNQEYFEKELFPLIQSNTKLLGWPHITIQDVKVKRMDSMSNQTFRVDLKIEGYPSLLAKSFGKGLLDELMDRKLDNSVSYLLGDKGVGPKVYLMTDQARIEEFIPSSQFTAEDMLNNRERNLLMYSMSRFHRVSIPDMPPGSLLSRTLSGDHKLIELFKKAVGQKQSIFTDTEKTQVKEILSLIDNKELEWLNTVETPFRNNLVISHNDFLNGNILRKPNGELALIDFEYTTSNFPMYDVANFLHESILNYNVDSSPYFKFHLENREPDEKIIPMLKYYLLFSLIDEDLPFDKICHLVDNPLEADKLLLQKLKSSQAIVSQIDEYLNQLHFGYMLSHFFWILWAIIMSKNPHNPFNYVQFAYERYRDYLGLKKTLYNC